MADSKKCKKCKESEEDCKCPKKGKKGFYGLDIHHNEDEGSDSDIGISDGGGGMSEAAVKMPREPKPEVVQKMSSREKKKTLGDFKAAADIAKKRKSDIDRKSELAHERRTKGIRFYDAKGKGYMKGGKKVYD